MADTTQPITTKRYIKRIRLENFQCYEDATLNLSSGINLITGSSDHGKTALVRALKFIMHNVWSPDFLRYGTSECRVMIWFNDGTVVQRIKGDQRNAVQLRLANGHVETLTSIGAGAYPAIVNKALGNPPTDESHGAISFAEQLEPLFMVMLNNSELPRNISELTGIDDLDEAATVLSRRSKQAQKQAKELTQRINSYEAELITYEHLDEKIEKLAELELIEAVINKQTKEIDAITDIGRRYSDVMQEGILNSKALKQAKQITVFREQFDLINKDAQEAEQINDLFERYAEICDDIDECQVFLEQAKKVAKEEFKSQIIYLNNELEQIKNIQTIINDINQINTEITNITEENNHLQLTITNSSLEVEKIRKLLQESGLLCPTCYRPLEEDICLK